MAGSAYEIYKLFNFQDASRGGRYHSEEQAVRSYSIHSRLTSRRLLEGADGRTHSAAREYRTDDAIRPPHLLRAAQHAIVCAKENHEARHRNAHKLAKSSHGAQGTDIAGHMAELVIPKVHRPQRTHDGATYSAVGHTRVTWRLLDRTSRHPQKLARRARAQKGAIKRNSESRKVKKARVGILEGELMRMMMDVSTVEYKSVWQMNVNVNVPGWQI